MNDTQELYPAMEVLSLLSPLKTKGVSKKKIDNKGLLVQLHNPYFNININYQLNLFVPIYPTLFSPPGPIP